ncbi:MAG TPA: penicillin-binding transpeptidase domain-containing protein [Bacilli bacterium]|nr:penicillin-binding transpeptidase domain-containing protein [Bacilli bacterium]
MNDRVMRLRSRWLRLGFLVLMVLLLMRLLYIQVAEANSLSDAAQDTIKVERPIVGTRGTIYDRSGENKLVFTGVAYDINISLDRFRAKEARKNGDTPEAYARFLAPLLGATEDELLSYMDNYDDPSMQDVKGIGLGPKSKKLPAEVNDKINEMHEQDRFLGISTIRTDLRQYPNNDFAAHVLGFYGMNAQRKSESDPLESGLAGIEAVYDDVLMGKPGFAEYYTDNAGNPLPTYDVKELVPPIDGKDVVLTLDSVIQHFVEDELNNIVTTYAPKHASIIVADPNNGEILALGNRPAYNPNEYAKADSEALWNNWALRSFEPGSTFKVFVLSAALAENKLNLNDTFESGSIDVGGETFSDWETTGWGRISYREGVYHSSNVGFVKIGQKLGKDLLYDYIYRFGFDKPTGIDLPAEGDSQLYDLKTMRESDLASTSFGQGISVTPMQQVMALCAVANGGTLYKPHLVKEFRDQETGETVKEFKPQAVGKIADEETLGVVRQVLEETVNADSLHRNYIQGYHVAGKTGTAQVPKGNGEVGYADNKYRLSFMGFAPSNKPRIVVYVTVDQPTQNAPFQFGSYIAAPSAKVVMEKSLRYLQVPVDPNDHGPDQVQVIQAGQEVAHPAPKKQEPVVYAKIPDLIGATSEQAKSQAEQSGFKLTVIGDGPRVTNQMPDVSYDQLPKGTEIKVYLGPEGSADGKVKMPDLSGQSLREAMETLQLLHLKIEPKGSGYVSKQGVPPGTLVPFGTAVPLELTPQS